jgi:arsenite methyltransferase
LKEYLSHSINIDDPEFISVIDELPLWSAPFGLKLLDVINIKHNMKVLDVGCGLGFPLIEIAERLGETSEVTGIDLWDGAIERVKLKIKIHDLSNVKVIKGVAEELPFDDSYFDLIVSNNGINNVNDMRVSLSECRRVCKPGGQFVITLNLEETMIEFYNVFKDVLKKNNLISEIEKIQKHIYSKRRPLDEIKQLIVSSGFKIKNIDTDKFTLRFADGKTMFKHSLISNWFLGGWKDIVSNEYLGKIFLQTEEQLNKIAEEKGEIKLTVPFVVIEGVKST